jgi:hypothetical protein
VTKQDGREVRESSKIVLVVSGFFSSPACFLPSHSLQMNLGSGAFAFRKLFAFSNLPINYLASVLQPSEQ